MLSRRTSQLVAAAVAAALVLGPVGARLGVAAPGARSTAPAAGTAPAGPQIIALAPLATLGVEAGPKETGTLHADLEGALATLPGVTVVGHAAVAKAVASARKPALRTCDGDPGCLADLGALVHADLVAFGELGGLGDAKIIYLSLVDVQTRALVRTATMQTASDGSVRDGGAAGATVRLVAPERYQGQLDVRSTVAGAAVYLNGQPIGATPLAPRRIAVGTHAVRITHPEHRDFVRFVDITFDATTTLEATLQTYAVVSSSVAQTPGEQVAPITTRETAAPWYRRWWVVAAAGVVLGAATGVTVGILAGGIQPAPDYTRPL